MDDRALLDLLRRDGDAGMEALLARYGPLLRYVVGGVLRADGAIVGFTLGEVLRDCPVLLPAGQYLSVVYAGDYAAFPSHCAALLRAGRERGLEPAGEPVELYHIDAHDTDRIGEYRTEIQIPVQPQGLEESSDFGYNRDNS